MRDSMKFVNHLNEIILLGPDNMVINENDFRNYEWTYNTQYKKVTTFEQKIKTRKLPLVIVGEDAQATANSLFEIIEKDVLGNEPGKMYVGDYYLKGYFYGSKKSDYTSGTRMTIELEFVSDQNYWIKETPFLYRLNNSEATEEGLGYTYGYPYDFLSPINIQNINNTSFVPVNFIMTIYGQVTNPEIIIAGHTYVVNCTVGKSEYLTINTLDKTIIRTKADGTKVNEFGNRGTDSYIFEKIPTGKSKVAMTTECNFDIVLMEERSEPKWI